MIPRDSGLMVLQKCRKVYGRNEVSRFRMSSSFWMMSDRFIRPPVARISIKIVSSRNYFRIIECFGNFSKIGEYLRHGLWAYIVDIAK